MRLAADLIDPVSYTVWSTVPFFAKGEIDPFSLNARIREDGLVVRDMMLAQVKTPAQSKAPWDYYNIVRNIPGDTLAWPLSESQCPLVKR